MKFFSRSKGAKTPETATPTETSASTAEVSPSASTISIPITSTNLVDMSEGALRERVYDLEREHAQSRADMFVPSELALHFQRWFSLHPC